MRYMVNVVHMPLSIFLKYLFRKQVVDLSGDKGPERSRKARLNNEAKLFSNFEFCLEGKFSTISMEQLRGLLQAAGGRVVRVKSAFSYNVGKNRCEPISFC